MGKLAKRDHIKEILEDMNKLIIPNFENPLLLSDYLTFYLDQDNNVEFQVLALKAIFILLEKHGLDYSEFYKKLYKMIKPQFMISEKSIDLKSIFAMPDKSRFLRLLDLSLRAP